jgi:hypothetical protein
MNPYVTVSMGAFWFPAMFDSGSSRSFIRQDVLKNIEQLKLPFTLEQAEERCVMVNGQPCVISISAHFSKATIFSVLDLNSAYYQIPLSAKSRKVTAFCTPFGLFEFTKLPMGISLGCQVLSRVVDALLGDFRNKFIYSFLDDLVVYSRSREEHMQHLKVVFTRLEKAGFTLNRDKIQLAKQEIPFLGHLISAQGIRILPQRVEAMRTFPPPQEPKGGSQVFGDGRFLRQVYTEFFSSS